MTGEEGFFMKKAREYGVLVIQIVLMRNLLIFMLLKPTKAVFWNGRLF